VKVVDLATVEADLARIGRVLDRRPELRERTAQFLAGDLPVLEDAKMGRTRGEPMEQIALRVSPDAMERARKLAERISAGGVLAGSETTPSMVLREAIEIGLDKIEAKLKVGKKSKR